MLASHTSKMAHEDAVTAALRVANAAIGDERPTQQALRIIAAIKTLRPDQPARIYSGGIDYLGRVQERARALWHAANAEDDLGPAHDATFGTDTPIGRLVITTWRRRWAGKKPRVAWASVYFLDSTPITVAEIKAAGLSQRPFTRNRKKKDKAL